MKKIVSTVLALVLILSFMPIALAKGYGDIYKINSVTGSKKGDKATVNITNLTEQKRKDMIIAASYVPGGRFLGCTLKKISLNPQESADVEVAFAEYDKRPLQVKIFIWDGFEKFIPVSRRTIHYCAGYDPDYFRRLNAEIIANLKIISEDIGKETSNPNSDFEVNDELYILSVIKDCVDETITYEDKLEITADFIKSMFEEEIAEVESVYDEIKAKGKTNVDSFHTKLAVNLHKESMLWMADFLGIDLSKYGINREDIK